MLPLSAMKSRVPRSAIKSRLRPRAWSKPNRWRVGRKALRNPPLEGASFTCTMLWRDA